MNNYILNLLNIKDENIYILERSEQKRIKGIDTKLLFGILTYIPECCPKCGTVNKSFNDIIKWGFKRCKVKIPKVSNCNSLLILDKQRFFCKNCNNTFVAQTSLVDSNCNISKNTDYQVRLELTNKISEKDIAKHVNISHSSVNRILDKISTKAVLRHSTLPKSMNWDEFKATNDTKGKMAFLIVDNDNGNVFDIQDSRKSIDLEKYFRRYPKYERNKVRFISTDFYSGYIYLAKRLFKNANIVIDRFHIVVQVYNALNITRVRLCKKSNPNYNKLKNYWKLLLKNKNDLDSKNKSYSPYFGKYLSQVDIVNYLINTNKELKATYDCYQGIINSIKERDFDKFKAIIHHPSRDISDKMSQALKLYREYEQYIANSFKYDINNGIIEGTNNLIKCVKRIAFGYRSYKHFTARIFLIKGIIKG